MSMYKLKSALRADVLTLVCWLDVFEPERISKEYVNRLLEPGDRPYGCK
jgi:hypothetical protein